MIKGTQRWNGMGENAPPYLTAIPDPLNGNILWDGAQNECSKIVDRAFRLVRVFRKEGGESAAEFVHNLLLIM